MWRRQASGWAVVLGILGCAVLVPCLRAAPAHDAELRFALRRAALELAAGRPEHAFRVLDRVQPVADRSRLEDLALLLRIESALLAGEDAVAVDLGALAEARSPRLRRHAAAHRLALAAAAGVRPPADVLAGWHPRVRRGDARARNLEAAGNLLARWVLGAGDAVPEPGGKPRVPAEAVATLMEAEALLEAGDFAAAARTFEALIETDADAFGGWRRDWARLGRARALWPLGRLQEAFDTLQEEPFQGRPESAYARALWVRMHHASDDGLPEAGPPPRDDSGMQAWNASLFMESLLLEAQRALDAGRWPAAESLASSVLDLSGTPDAVARAAHPYGRRVQFDAMAWHAAWTRRTLQALVDAGVLRRVPQPMALADTTGVVVVTDANAPQPDGRIRWTLLEPYTHGGAATPPELEAARRDLAQQFTHAQLVDAERQRLRRALRARRGWMARADTALAPEIRRLEAMLRESATFDSALTTYRADLAATEAAWRTQLAVQLHGVQRTLDTLDRALRRLDARYPEDRSVRSSPRIDAAYAERAAARAWQRDLTALRARLQSRLEERVHAVLLELEPADAARALAALGRELRAVVAEARRLRARLADLDADLVRAATRLEVEWQAAQARLRDAAARRDTLALAFETARRQQAQARLAAYRMAALDAAATASFLAALESQPAADSLKLARLEAAVSRLEAFLADYPAAPRAAELTYRLAEAHVQRAAVRHRVEVARFLAAGGDPNIAPLPVEDASAALEVYARLLEHYPESPRVPDAHHQMGFLLADMGAPRASSEHLEAFLAAVPPGDPREGRAALRLGENLLQLGERRRALAAFARAAQTHDAEAHDLGLFESAWLAYDLDRHDETRAALRELLDRASQEPDAAGSHARELLPEALELLALSFTSDHEAFEALDALESWGHPQYGFALVRRMARLFGERAQVDAAVRAWATLFERYPEDPALAGAAEEWIALVRRHEGASPAHELAADLALHFAPGGAWARAAAQPHRVTHWEMPQRQARLVEDDVRDARADSLAAALATPEAAGRRAARHLRAAAVHAHRQAATDSLRRRAWLQEAERLYAESVQHFPEAEDHVETWLYLADVRQALGDDLGAVEAAEAVLQDAAADSTLRTQAASLKFAALDAAAERAPSLYLERYRRAAREMLAQHPHAPLAQDGLERAAEIAFRAGDYEAAREDYARLAEHLDDPLRAARALKAAGDCAWQREEAADAAAWYAQALQRAPQSGADSLVMALRVLVPGALSRAAAQDEAAGQPQRAAERLERLASTYPEFVEADRAWYRAATLRRAHGDLEGARRDHRRLLEAYPASAVRADAMLELASLEAEQGDSLAAARAYETFATTFAEHPQALDARMLAGTWFENAGEGAAADRAYAAVLERLEGDAGGVQDSARAGDLWIRRARLAQAPAAPESLYGRALQYAAALEPRARAEARFARAEALRPAYEAVRLEAPLDKSLKAKKKALEKLLPQYAQVMEEGVEPWHAAASLRLGEALANFAMALRRSTPPADLEGDDLWAYQEVLDRQAQELEDRAVQAWSEGLQGARVVEHTSTWTQALEAALYPMLAQRVDTQPAPHFVLVRPE